MEDDITKQLQAIKERCEDATPGPWVVMMHGNYGERVVIDVSDGMPDEMLCVLKRPEDAQFIAHSREDIPTLLSEVTRLSDDLKFAIERLIAAYAAMMPGEPGRDDVIAALAAFGVDEDTAYERSHRGR